MVRLEAETARATNLYEHVADRLQRLIEGGTLRPGQRLPSVRETSRRERVSMATAVQAYRVLETRQLVEARPRSGYYVRQNAWKPPEEPEVTRPLPQPTEVSLGDLSLRLVQAANEPGVIRLGAAVPDPEFLPVNAVMRAVNAATRKHGAKTLTYRFPPGDASLRRHLARRLVNTGCTVAPEELIVTHGCQEALHLALRAVAAFGDTIAIESPAYYGVLQLIESLGMKALEIPTHPRDGISVEALSFAMEHHAVAAVLVVPSFSNPLGSCMPDERRRELVELCETRGVPLIEDDIYGELHHGEARPRAAKAFDTTGNVIYCSSFSKTLAPGLRLGYMAPGRFREKVQHLQFVTTMSLAPLAQIAVAGFLADGGYDRHLRRTRKAYADQLFRLNQAVARWFPDETRVTRPQGGFLLWVELPDSVDSMHLHRLALAERISIAPGPLFSATGKYRNFIRLNGGCRWGSEVETAMVRLGQLTGQLVENASREATRRLQTDF